MWGKGLFRAFQRPTSSRFGNKFLRRAIFLSPCPGKWNGRHIDQIIIEQGLSLNYPRKKFSTNRESFNYTFNYLAPFDRGKRKEKLNAFAKVAVIECRLFSDLIVLTRDSHHSAIGDYNNRTWSKFLNLFFFFFNLKNSRIILKTIL